VYRNVRKCSPHTRAGYKKRFVNHSPPSSLAAGLFSGELSMAKNDIKTGYAYHIKDDYFDVAKDEKLMQGELSGKIEE